MALTLTSAAISSRKGIRYGIYFLVFVFIARFAINQAVTLYKRLVPKAPPPPTVGFSRLPSILFPEQVTPIPEMNYKIETATGTLPTLTTVLKVYLMPKALPTLSSADRAIAKAAKLGFTAEPIKTSEVLYRFLHPTVAATLDMNIVNNNFSTSYNLAADSEPLEGAAPSVSDATEIAEGILDSIGGAPEDLTGPIVPEFLRLDGQNLVTAASLAEANFVKINFFRKTFEEELNKYPSVTPNSKQANVWFIIGGGSQREKRLIASEFHYFPITATKFETYPIKTAQQAIDDLKENRGYIANLGLNKDGNVTIRRIYLAYYDADQASQFYQPVVVFEGDRGFVAYVPAVVEEYYGE